MDKNHFYMPERSGADRLILAVLREEDTREGGFGYETPGGHKVRGKGRLTRDDSGKLQGGSVKGTYRTPGGHEFNIGWEYGVGGPAPTPPPPSTPAPAPSPDPAPAPEPEAPPSPSPRRSRSRGTGTRTRGTGTPARGTSRRRRPAGGTPPSPSSPAPAPEEDDDGPRIEVDTATVRGVAHTGVGKASKMRAAAKKQMRDLVKARRAVLDAMERTRARPTNPFAGARGSVLPSVPFPGSTPKQPRWKKFRRAAMIGGAAAAVYAAAKNFN